MKNKILTGLQIILVLIWLMGASDDALNPFQFNFMPIPNFGDMFVGMALLAVGMWLQKFKTVKVEAK